MNQCTKRIQKQASNRLKAITLAIVKLGYGEKNRKNTIAIAIMEKLKIL